jgi:hypothetical protein
MMITSFYFIPNASGLVCAKNLHKWAEKAFASSTLVFHGLFWSNYISRLADSSLRSHISGKGNKINPNYFETS